MGRQRKKSAGTFRRFSALGVMVLAVASIGGFSVYTALSPGNLEGNSTAPDVVLPDADPSNNDVDLTSAPPKDGLAPQSGRSGANV